MEQNEIKGNENVEDNELTNQNDIIENLNDKTNDKINDKTNRYILFIFEKYIL